MTEKGDPNAFEREAQQESHGLLREYVDFLRHNKKWWLLPIVLVLAAVGAFLYLVPISLWVTAIFSGVRVNLLDLVFMRIRRVPPGLIVRSLMSLLSRSALDTVDGES